MLFRSHRVQQQQQQRRPPPPTAPLSPMSNASNAMQSMTIRNMQTAPATTANMAPRATTANTNPFASSGGQGNLFRQLPPPVTSADHDALQQSLAYYPLLPNTPEGNSAWLGQLRDWRAKHGESPITPATGFPLRPGGGAPGSGECFRCGLVGHCWDSGLCNMEAINPHEHTFWTICGCILHAVPAAQVNFVEDSGGEFGWLSDRSLAHTVDQGNGEGSSA